MTVDLKNATRKILANTTETEKIYPYLDIDTDVDYFYKKLCELSPHFIETDLERQAEIIAFCFHSGLNMVKKLIKRGENIIGLVG